MTRNLLFGIGFLVVSVGVGWVLWSGYQVGAPGRSVGRVTSQDGTPDATATSDERAAIPDSRPATPERSAVGTPSRPLDSAPVSVRTSGRTPSPSPEPSAGRLRPSGTRQVIEDAPRPPAERPAVASPVEPASLPDAEPAEQGEGDELVWSVDADGIQAAVAEATPAMEECYAGWVRANKELGGRILVRFVIDEADGEGVVREASLVSDEVEHPLLTGCVLNAMSELKFEPPADGPTTVNYPVVFSNAD